MNFAPNPEQIESLVRSFVNTFGAFIAGWFAAKGWFTVDQVLSVLNSPVLAGAVVSIVTYVWGLKAHTDVSTITAANAIPAVQGVITVATIEGKALAAAIPEATVAVAGTTDAAAVAAK